MECQCNDQNFLAKDNHKRKEEVDMECQCNDQNFLAKNILIYYQALTFVSVR